jgi:hypothetical protein
MCGLETVPLVLVFTVARLRDEIWKGKPLNLLMGLLMVSLHLSQTNPVKG